MIAAGPVQPAQTGEGVPKPATIIVTWKRTWQPGTDFGGTSPKSQTRMGFS